MVREERVESFYARLRESARASSLSPLLIFPSTSDVDSLCALKIIFYILESDSVRYSCYPVSSFQEIREYAASETLRFHCPAATPYPHHLTPSLNLSDQVFSIAHLTRTASSSSLSFLHLTHHLPSAAPPVVALPFQSDHRAFSSVTPSLLKLLTLPPFDH